MTSRLAGIGLLLAGLAGFASGAEVRLRIMETTDLHMNLLSYDYYQDKATDQYGLDRAITLIKAARAEAPNSLLFDNGDLLQGNPLGDYVAKIKPLQDGEVHPAYKVMNQLGYDAGNLGNHEFNFGLPFLRRALAGANFPYVNANVFLEDKAAPGGGDMHAFTPYVILDRQFSDAQGTKHAIKIGVIGFVPPQILTWDKGHLEGRVVTRDMVAMAQKYVPEMRAKGAQLVVLVPHSGFERSALSPMAENGVSGLAEVPGVDEVRVLGELLGLQAIEAVGPGGDTFRDAVDEAVHLIGVGLAIALGEEVENGVAPEAIAIGKLNGRVVHVAGPQHAFCAMHLHALVIAIGGAA